MRCLCKLLVALMGRKTCKGLDVKRLCLLVALCVAIAGCGTTGATKTFVLPIDSAATNSLEYPLKLGSFAVAEDANFVIAAGTNEWGTFDEADQHNFAWSMQATLDNIDGQFADEAAPSWEIHVLLRRHVIAHDNSSAGVLVCVSWALASASGAVVYEEQFYAADRVVLVGTLGGVKNSVNRAVAQRIVESSLRLASSEPLSSTRVEDTYDTITEAANTLPAQYQSLAIVRFHRLADGILVPSVVRPQDETVKTVEWEEFDAKEPVNWQQHLED